MPNVRCREWKELKELKGISICTQHDRALDILTVEGDDYICAIGAELDTEEFLAKISRSLGSLRKENGNA